jgi:hypothetical protein
MTFDLLYNLCYQQSDGVSKELKDIASGSWIDAALESVERRRHGYDRILMLAYVARHNADLGESIPCTISELQSAAPKAYTTALRTLPAEARRLVCPDCC